MSLADESSLLFIPTGYKESKIYSVFPTTGVGDFTFNRNSSATRIAKNGLITSVATDIPRLEYPLIDGVVNGCPSLLLEPQRTNLVTYSEDFSNAYWTKSAVSLTDGFISPDGTSNAFKLIEDGTNAFHGFYQNANISLPIGKITMSIFVKANGRDYFQLRTGSTAGITGAPLYANFDLTNDSVSASSSGVNDAKIESYTNNWKKISISFTVTSGSLVSLVFQPITTSSAAIGETYQGDGTSGVYIYGAQLEQGSYATSYIPTNGTTVTRLAETANGAGDATTFNDSEGVLMAEISALANDLTNRFILIGTTSNNVYIRYQSSSNSLRCNVTVNGSSQFIAIVTLDDETINSKISVKYKENDFNLYVNGFKVFTDLGGSTFTDGTLTELAFDNGLTSNFPFYGKTKQIQYFQIALTDSELEQLTSWTSFTDLANGQQYSIK